MNTSQINNEVSTLDTTLHIVDPKNPGAVDEIINLGEYWDEEGMVRGKEAIINCNKNIGGFFRSAYHYLASAKEMQDDIETIVENAVDRAKFNQMLLELKAELVDGIESVERVGKIRHLFDSAITPDGLIDYIETIITKKHKCYFLKGQHTTGSTELLGRFAEAYSIRGYDVELYHQPLNPERFQTLVVDELDIAFTVNPKLEEAAYMVINMDKNIDDAKLKEKADAFAKDKEMMQLMMAEAVNRINQAKKLHDIMETYYIPNMNFEEINKVKNRTIERIKNLIKE